MALRLIYFTFLHCPMLLQAQHDKKQKKSSPWKFDYPLSNDAKISKLATLKQLKFLRLLINAGPSLHFLRDIFRFSGRFRFLKFISHRRLSWVSLGNVMRLNISRNLERTRTPYIFSSSTELRLVVTCVIVPNCMNWS